MKARLFEKQANQTPIDRQGFTLVEIMIVVVIIGILATLAIPALQRVRLTSQNSRFINDIRVFRAAMDHYIFETGDYPGDGGSGNLHPNMEDYITVSQFETSPSVGGVWDIELNKSGVVSAVGVHGPTVPNEQLTLIDEMLDDGDIANGNLRFIAADRYYWVLIE